MDEHPFYTTRLFKAIILHYSRVVPPPAYQCFTVMLQDDAPAP